MQDLVWNASWQNSFCGFCYWSRRNIVLQLLMTSFKLLPMTQISSRRLSPEMNCGSMATIQKWRHSCPSGSRLVLRAWRRCGKATARSRPCELCLLIGKVLSILQAKQLIRSTTSMFFISWEMQYNENGHSYGQLAIGSFVRTTRPLMRHVLWRDFWWNVNSPRWLGPSTAQIGSLWLLAFLKTKITFEREEISDRRWNWGKYVETIDDSNKGFCRVFWTMEEMLGGLCEVLWCLLWRGLRRHCPMYNASCILYLL